MAFFNHAKVTIFFISRRHEQRKKKMNRWQELELKNKMKRKWALGIYCTVEWNVIKFLGTKVAEETLFGGERRREGKGSEG